MTMNPDVKAEWLTALRSGEYPQTTGSLHRLLPTSETGVQPGFCCLGVLCDLAKKAGIVQEEVRGDVAYYRGANDRDTALLPDDVVKWAGLTSKYGIEEDYIDEVPEGLPALNDGGASFAAIANIIEEHL